MPNLIKCIAVAICALPILAFGAECGTIKQDKQRLACYDAGTPGAKSVAAGKTATTGSKIAFRSGHWTVDQSIDAMTDKKSCTALYKGDWNIQADDRDLYIPLKRRGGVSYYTIRLNDESAQPLQNATEREGALSAIILEPYFDRIYSGKRLRIQIGTLVNGVINEDIDLKGFKESVDFIRDNCRG